ncbi:MAG: OadG family protein [Dehalococcoidales bacterium]|nr:MAG: OadG family protein [Dehalococcoidales bacterium]
MDVDWGLARQIGGTGFGIVFAVLVILAIVLWLTGLVTGKFSTTKNETTDDQKGA